MDRGARRPAPTPTLRALALTRRTGAHLHLRAPGLRPAHRHRSRRGRLPRPRRVDPGHDPADPASFPGVRCGRSARPTSSCATTTPPVDATRRRLTFRRRRTGYAERRRRAGLRLPERSDDRRQRRSHLPGRWQQRRDRDVEPAASNWLQVGTAAKPGYKYRDPKGSTGRSPAPFSGTDVLTIRGRGAPALPARGRAAGDHGAPDEPRGARSTGARRHRPAPPSSTFDTTERFEGVKNTPPPASCPALPDGYGSPSRAFLSRPTSLLD